VTFAPLVVAAAIEVAPAIPLLFETAKGACLTNPALCTEIAVSTAGAAMGADGPDLVTVPSPAQVTKLASEVVETTVDAAASLLRQGGLPEGKQFAGTLFRGVNPNYADKAWEVTARNIAADHRYSGEGRGALYASTSWGTMAAELNHYKVNASDVAVMMRQTAVENILDLTDPAVRTQLGVSLDQLTGENYFMTQAIGDFARGRYNGILAPSARDTAGANLVLFEGFE
jgi:RES domain-containing protein